MGIQDLQTFLESEGVGVDLFRISRNHPGGLRLVLDAEGCLDRLYGGYFSGCTIYTVLLQLQNQILIYNVYFRLGMWRPVGAMYPVSNHIGNSSC